MAPLTLGATQLRTAKRCPRTRATRLAGRRIRAGEKPCKIVRFAYADAVRPLRPRGVGARLRDRTSGHWNVAKAIVRYDYPAMSKAVVSHRRSVLAHDAWSGHEAGVAAPHAERPRRPSHRFRSGVRRASGANAAPDDQRPRRQLPGCALSAPIWGLDERRSSPSADGTRRSAGN